MRRAGSIRRRGADGTTEAEVEPRAAGGEEGDVNGRDARRPRGEWAAFDNFGLTGFVM